MLIPDLYKRQITDDDGTRTEVRADNGMIRVCTDVDTRRPTWLTVEQAKELREALDEAIWVTQLVNPDDYPSRRTAAAAAAR